MSYLILVCAVIVGFSSAAMADQSPVKGATPRAATSSVSSVTHSHADHMSWNDVYLCARIFLGRLPKAMPGSESDTPERISLGKRLYFERGISTTKSQSCHDCHLLTEGRAGADVSPTSKGAKGTFGTRNSPTVINAGFQTAQFWDGRAKDLVEQAKGPILNPVEMGMQTEQEVVEHLRGSEGHVGAFRRAFPGESDPVSYDNLAKAIAAFERTLVAPGRFDLLLDGQQNAMNAKEKRGLTKFIQYGCVECHAGITVGGQLFKVLGQRNPYPDKDDLGRYDVTKEEVDRYVFKVPMLRNVTRTSPYFHDGQVFALEEAVARMGWYQLDRRLTSDDTTDLIAFLRTLEGTLPPIKEP